MSDYPQYPNDPNNTAHRPGVRRTGDPGTAPGRGRHSPSS